MAKQGLSELRQQLGGDVPAGLAKLTDAECSDLAQAIRAARHRQAEVLNGAGDRALAKVPRLLRGPLRKLTG
jgi:hypothetical protein